MEWGYGVADPVEADDGVDDDGEVVHPYLFVSQRLSQELVLCVWITETPVVIYIPEACVD